MNSIDKVILLSEYFGNDVTDFKNSYHNFVIDGKVMDKLKSNIEEMQKYDTEKIMGLVAQYHELMKERPISFEDEVVFNAKVNYLCGITYEQYYLNPFTVGNNETTTKSIGELMLIFDGRYVSINDIILDNSHSLSSKTKVVAQQVDIYHKEMTKVLRKSVNEIKQSKTSGDKSVQRSRIGHFFIDMIFFLENIYLMLLLFFDGQVFTSAIKFSFDNVYSYAFYLPFICGAVFDITFIVANCFRKKDQESYYFAKRYLDFCAKNIFINLANEAIKLHHYIVDAIKTHKILTDDIRKFSKVGGDELDLYGLISMKSKKDSPGFRLVMTLRNIAMTISIIAMIFSGILFILQHLGLLGNIAV